MKKLIKMRIILLFYIFIALFTPYVGFADNWPMFKHDVLRTSYTSERLYFPLEAKWTSFYQTEGPITGAPAVADGKVYFRIDGPLGFAGYFYVLDAETGSLIWKRITPGRISSAGPTVIPTVTVTGGIAYIGFNYFYADGRYSLWALDPNTQSIVRRYIIGGYVHSNPAIVGDRMYVGSWSQINRLWAFDINQDTSLWSYPEPGQFSDYILSSPAVAYPIIFIGSYNGNMYAILDNYPIHVKTLWQYYADGRIYSTPAIGAGKIYFGTEDGKIHCVDAGNGNVVWTYPTGDWVWSSPAVGKDKDNNDIVVVGSDDGWVYALYADTGNLKWKFKTGGKVRSSPAIAYDTVLFGSMDGNFYAVDINTGSEVYKFNVGSPIRSSPAVANGCVYFGADNGKFYALESKAPPPPPPTGIVDATPKIFDPSGDNDDNILGTTTISYELENPANVVIKIYYSTKTFDDTTLVRTFPAIGTDELPPPGEKGENQVVWDGLRYDDPTNPNINPHNKRKIVQEGTYTIKVYTNGTEFGSTTVDVRYHMGM